VWVWAYVEGERRESGGEEATEAEEAQAADAVGSGDQDAGQRSCGRWLFPLEFLLRHLCATDRTRRIILTLSYAANPNPKTRGNDPPKSGSTS